jgi:hypothetical protein
VSAADDAKLVAKNIQRIWNEKNVPAIFALAEKHKADALDDFHQRQASDAFWQNRTGQAYIRVFAQSFKKVNAVGFYMAHGAPYGVYLELANNRLHEALRPIVEINGLLFLESVKEMLR